MGTSLYGVGTFHDTADTRSMGPQSLIQRSSSATTCGRLSACLILLLLLLLLIRLSCRVLGMGKFGVLGVVAQGFSKPLPLRVPHAAVASLRVLRDKGTGNALQGIVVAKRSK